MNDIVAVDIETFDPRLHDTGDGSCRVPHSADDDGSRILCVGVYNGKAAKAYEPNTEHWREMVSLLEDEHVDKVFHNGVYDLSWLVCRYGINVKGLCHDTMTRMTYIDEYADLSLDSCCKYFRVVGKNKEDTIERWYAEHIEDVRRAGDILGVKITKSTSLWRVSDMLWDNFSEFRENMVKYNLQDCKATYDLYFAQEAAMHTGMLYDAYMTDVKLTPLVIRMKKQGVLIDKEALGRLTGKVQEDIVRVEKVLLDTYGVSSDMLGSSKKLGARLNEMGIHSPMRTGTGAESWGSDAMDRLMHYPVIPLIRELKQYKKLMSTYLQGGLVDSILSTNRIHCTFSPNKREDGGTVTGRFACSRPNLQQIPARDKHIGHSYAQTMRSLFIPEEGCMMSAIDYSQIEYLLLAHFAQGEQAEWFRQQACSGVDFHTVAMQATGIPERQVVKTFNYGVIYGMGCTTALQKNYALFEQLAQKKGQTAEEYAREVYEAYHARLPVIRATMQYVQKVAKIQGFVTTLGGRRQHKPKPYFDSSTGKVNDFIYKMLNKLIQGSAADVLKTALLTAYEAGVFDVLKLHLTVHDENVVSVPYCQMGAEANAELQHIMDMSFHDKLKVPMKAACELGPDWGYWSDDIWEDMKKGIFNRQQECWWYKAA